MAEFGEGGKKTSPSKKNTIPAIPGGQPENRGMTPPDVLRTEKGLNAAKHHDLARPVDRELHDLLNPEQGKRVKE